MARIGLSLAICIIVIVSVAAATAVTITKSTLAEKGGFFIRPYYEFLNAPVTGCTAPCLTVDTQPTPPNPTKGTLSLDGSGGGATGGGNTIAISLTTTTANDVLYLSSVARLASVQTISSSPSLTWTQRRSVSFTEGGSTINLETWYAIRSSSGAISITVTDTATNTGAAVAFGISGANTASPFDSNGAVPATATDGGTAGTTATVSISTNNPKDLIIGAVGVSGGAPALTNGGSFTPILTQASGTSRETAGEYQIVSSTQTNLAVSYSWMGALNWAMIADAVVQASGSFSLAAGSSMYLWTPQFGTSTSIPAGSLSLQLFADPPAPALDGSASGTWASGTTFTIASFSTTKTNDVVVLSVQTYLSGSTITVSSVSDTQAKITWKSSARSTVTSCSGTQRSTNIEWYGTAATVLSTDTVTVTLSSTPSAASGIAFGISGADTTTPFDPTAGLPQSAVSTCTSTTAAPSVSGVSTVSDNNFVFALFGGYTSTTETVGSVAGNTANMIKTVTATGDSNAAEYTTTSSRQSGTSCAFGTTTTYWSALCDAVMPARQTVTISFVTTNSAGTVQSTMISGSSATITGAYAPISIASSAGTVPASGYIRVLITAPASTALTVFWGYGKLTQFQVSYTVRTQ